MSFLNSISDWVKGLFSSKDGLGTDEPETDPAENREKIIAFSIAFFISVCLWFIVNLSRDFNVTIQVPIQVASIPEDEIVSSEVPDYASVNVSGEGWNVIPVYNSPPRLLVTAENGEVNLSEQMRNQITAFSDLNILQVQPPLVTIETEKKATKKVPVTSNVELNLSEQFGLLEDPVITPDSVTISGTADALENITEWSTEEVQINDVNSDLQRNISLQQPEPGMSLEFDAVNFQVEVAEFTEAEVRVPIRTRNLPDGRAVTYNPSSITVRFGIPIDQYSEIQGEQPFQAFVDYSVLEEDSSGRIAPEVEIVETRFNIRFRNIQPSRVSYFRIVPE